MRKEPDQEAAWAEQRRWSQPFVLVLVSRDARSMPHSDNSLPYMFMICSNAMADVASLDRRDRLNRNGFGGY
jgi:hypothetical protein